MVDILRHQLNSGLHLIAEPVAGAQSLAMSMLMPAGVCAEPSDRQGVVAVLAEMLTRGAGDRDAKAHCEALDQLGVQRSTDVYVHHLQLSATMLGQQLAGALPLLIDMIRRPRLESASLEPCRTLALQSIASLDDEPQDRTFIHLRRQHVPEPFGRSTLGQREHVEAVTIDDVRQHWRRHFVPRPAVLAFAGQFDWPQLKDLVEQQLGDWTGHVALPSPTAQSPRGYLHDSADSTQVHIGLAYDAVAEPHPDSVLQRVANSVLTGGMSARLFTEIRERHGLCYAVYSQYASDRDRGVMLAYAGTTTPRAQQTLDLLIAELHRLAEGVTASEFDRAVVGMKSSLVMQGESTSARATAIAVDQTVLGEPRTLAERAAEIDAVDLDRLNGFLREHRPGPMTIVTIGPTALKLESTETALT